MAGWQCKDRETIEWDGTIKSKQFIGDGSQLTGISGTGAVDSVFSRTGDVVAATNDYTWAQINKGTSDIADITTRSHTSLTDIGTNTHAQIDTAITASTNHIADLSIHYASGAIWTAINLRASSSALVSLDNAYQVTSGAYLTHAASGAIHTASAAITSVLTSSGAVIASGAYIDIVVPFNCNLARATILPDASGSLTVNVQKCTYANYPTFSAFKDYSLVSTNKYQTTDSGAISLGDIIRVVASGAATSIGQATITLEVIKL